MPFDFDINDFLGCVVLLLCLLVLFRRQIKQAIMGGEDGDSTEDREKLEELIAREKEQIKHDEQNTD
jgi:hypothetical protein